MGVVEVGARIGFSELGRVCATARSRHVPLRRVAPVEVSSAEPDHRRRRPTLVARRQSVRLTWTLTRCHGVPDSRMDTRRPPAGWLRWPHDVVPLRYTGPVSKPEPWLRGAIAGIQPLLMPLFHAFEHTREDVAAATDGLTTEQLWARPHGLTPIGFHVRHIGGAAERLGSYLRGTSLSPAQLAALAAERAAGARREELLTALHQALGELEAYVRTIDPATLAEARAVGRQQLPTSVIGLLTHIAEHSLRHTGQVVTTAQLVRALSPGQ